MARDRDADGFYRLIPFETLNPGNRVRNRHMVGRGSLIRNTSQFTLENGIGVPEIATASPYEIPDQPKSWTHKAWNVAARYGIPAPSSSGYRSAGNRKLRRVLRITLSFRVDHKRHGGKIVETVARVPTEKKGYASCDTLEDLSRTLNLIGRHCVINAPGYLGRCQKTGFSDSYLVATMKALVIYDDASYDATIGTFAEFLSQFELRLSHVDGTVEIPLRNGGKTNVR